MNTKSTVVIAMSGGVDSSVAAALLVEQGYTVIGMMLRLWSDTDTEQANRCCSPDSVAMARRVAGILSIPFYVLDARQFFYDHVVKPFMHDYSRNITPNPCITCNRIVRWDFLLNRALTSGADYLATGHYARKRMLPGGAIQLLRGIDAAKDQSYVLHTLSQKQLKRTLFPLGELNKPNVRQLAGKYNLPVADKPDSQDLCFTGSGDDYRSFLYRHHPEAFIRGPIMSHEGQLLGYHDGLPGFTIGQRKGLKISSSAPLYVLEKNLAKNTLVVGSQDQLGSAYLEAQKVSWIAGTPPQSPLAATVKIRYRAADIPCRVENTHPGKFCLQFDKPVRDITPGQAAVLYNGEVCLGGGIIYSESHHE